MRNVADVLTLIDRRPIFVPPTALVCEVVRPIAEHPTGAVLITQNEMACGIFTHRDLVCRVSAHNLPITSTPVERVMTRHLVSVGPDTSPEICLSTMCQKGVKLLVVEEAGRVLGLVSVLDIVNQVFADPSHLIHELEQKASESWPI